MLTIAGSTSRKDVTLEANSHRCNSIVTLFAQKLTSFQKVMKDMYSMAKPEKLSVRSTIIPYRI